MPHKPYTIDTGTIVAVAGAGTRGGGIAEVAAMAGHRVRLYDPEPEAAAQALERIAAGLAGAVQRRRLDAGRRDAALAAITPVETLDALEGCGVVVEAMPETLEAKRALLREVEHVVDADAVLATTTSTLSVTAVAQGLHRPQRVIGLHFFNPVPRMKLVEVVRGLDTDPGLAVAARALARGWGKTPVMAPNSPGFIVNRVSRPYTTEALRLLAEGLATAPGIDRLLTEAGGFSLGPFDLIDLVGADADLALTRAVFEATHGDARYAPHPIEQEAVHAGRLGRKSGRGFYDYRPGAARPYAAALVPAGSPPPLRAARETGLLGPLVERLRAAGIAAATDEALEPGLLAFGDVRLALTDGRTATERAAGGRLVLLDLARDYAGTHVVGAAASAGAEADLSVLAALLQPAGIELLTLADVAGLGLMRIVCGLVNEACDVMTWHATSAADIDIAMVLGASHPVGPLAWGDALGPSTVLRVLRHLQAHYGDARYRCSPRLSRAHFAGQRLHD